MIYTVTLNPSLDYIVKVKDFQTGVVNRTEDEKIFPGGKGINVSMVLQNLGVENTALGFIAGFTGNEIERALHEQGCLTDFIRLEEGTSRINYKLREVQETEINGQGPQIRAENLKKLFEKLEQLKDGDILVLAGSIPGSVPADIYQQIMKRLQKKSIRIVVDATKEQLVPVLQYHPFLIKPNHYELGEIFGTEIKTLEEVIPYAQRLQKMGARNVLISMAGEGAAFLAEREVGQSQTVYRSKAPNGRVRNSVGAGDSMVAGFLAGYEENNDAQTAFYKSVITGSASAFSEHLATKKEIDDLWKRWHKEVR